MKNYQAPTLFPPMFPEYGGHKVCLGLSGGINSAAMLCWLATAPLEMQPAELHLVYHHFQEHSPDTKPFVLACLAYAQTKFSCVIYKETDNSVLAFFEKSKMIPHPALSPCTKYLKRLPMMAYMAENGITHNPIGYVYGEAARRGGNMAKRTKTTFNTVEEKGIKIQFPISDYDDEWCFKTVVEAIGWYPAIYDIKNDKGKRIFAHNNCLPCKNMNVRQLADVETHFPDYMARARETELAVGRHWGRDEVAYYAQFGKHERDPNAGTPCGMCVD